MHPGETLRSCEQTGLWLQGQCVGTGLWDTEERVNKDPTRPSGLQEMTGHVSFPQLGFERMEIQDMSVVGSKQWLLSVQRWVVCSLNAHGGKPPLTPDTATSLCSVVHARCPGLNSSSPLKFKTRSNFRVLPSFLLNVTTAMAFGLR